MERKIQIIVFLVKTLQFLKNSLSLGWDNSHLTVDIKKQKCLTLTLSPSFFSLECKRNGCRIIESSRLEKTFKITKSNCHSDLPNPITKGCP